MRKSEITLLLPPAELKTNGDIWCREYPLVLYGSLEAPVVYVDNIDISPGTGVVEILMTGEGVEERRHSIGVGSSRLPQAAATEMQPLEMRIMNLNPDSSVHVVISTTAVERIPIGAPEAFGGAVRFRGSHPLGTDGKRELSYGDRGDDNIVIADGPLWKAYFTRNSAVSIRNIRDITSQVRVLSATGTGKIGVTGGGKRVIIVKKDGVTLEVETESLDFRNIFDMELPSSGNVQILGLIADAIATEAVQNGAITSAKIGTGAVTTAKVADGAVTPAKLDRAYATPAQLSSGLSGKANTVHTHDDRYYTEAQVDALVDSAKTFTVTNLSDESYAGTHTLDFYKSLSYLKTEQVSAGRVRVAVDVGTGSQQVAAGGHKHSTNSVFNTTHTINKTTTPRQGPGTEYFAYPTLPAGYGITVLWGGFTSGGVNWFQTFSPARGVCWINRADFS